MIRKYLDRALIGATLLASCALSGCAGVTAASITAAESSFIADVQAASSAACSFLPTADSIANLFTAASALSATAETIAADICQSLTAPTASMKLAKRKMGTGSLPVVTLAGKSYVIQGSLISH